MQPEVLGPETATRPPTNAATAEEAPHVQVDVGALCAGELPTDTQQASSNAPAPTAASFVPRFLDLISRIVGCTY